MAREFTRPERRIGQNAPGLKSQAVPLAKGITRSIGEYLRNVKGGAKIVAGLDERGPLKKEELGQAVKKTLVGEDFGKGDTGGALGLVQETVQSPLRLAASTYLTGKELGGTKDSTVELGKVGQAFFGSENLRSFGTQKKEGETLIRNLGGTEGEVATLPLLGIGLAGFMDVTGWGGAKKPVKDLFKELAEEASENAIKNRLVKEFPHLSRSSDVDTLARNLAGKNKASDIQKTLEYEVKNVIDNRQYTVPEARRIELETEARLPKVPATGDVRVYYARTVNGDQFVSLNRELAERYARERNQPVVTADVPKSELIEVTPVQAREGVFKITDDLAEEARLEQIIVEQELLKNPEFNKLAQAQIPKTDSLSGLRAVDQNALGVAEDGAPIADNLAAYGRSVGGRVTAPQSSPLPGLAPAAAEVASPRSFRRHGGDVIAQAQDSYRAATAAGGRVGGGPGTAQFVKEGIRPRPTVAQETGRLFDVLLTPISSRLERINPELKNVLRKFEFSVAQKTTRQSEAVLPLLRASRSMSEGDRAVFDLALKNGDKEVIDAVAKKYGLEKEIAAARDVLDDLYKRAKAVGIDVKYRENYFPRVVKNPDAFIAYLRGTRDWGNIQKEIQRRAEAKGVKYSDLDNEEKTAIVNNILRGYGDRVTLAGSGFTKARTLETIDDTLNQFYEPFDTALSTYIIRMNDEIEGRKFFGKQLVNAPEDINTRDSIGAYVLKLIEEGKIRPDQESEVIDILKARFSRGKMNGALDAYRNLEYMSTMGSPISAITQLGDIAWSLYENGWYNTAKGLGKTITRKGITKEQLGIEQITQEFNNQTKTGKALNKVFKAVGLEAMDRLGKETLVNGQMAKLVSQAKKEDPELLAKLDFMFEDDALKVLDDLKANRVTDDTKYMTFNTLLDYQPVAKSEMPQKYLEMPNGRIFYMLKSFTLKQIDVFRRASLDDLASGDMRKAPKAMKNLMYLAGMFVLANATADELKDTVLGRETSMSDRLVDNMWRLFGASKYDVYKARQEGVGTTILKKVLFPASLLDRGSTDIENAISGKTYEKGPNAGERYKIESTQSIPGVGKLFYWWFGRGAQKEDQKAGGTSVSADGRRSFTRTSESTERREFTR